MNKNMLLFKDKSIIFAEDDAITRTHTQDVLMMFFDKVYSALDGKEAYRLYKEKMPDIILTDIKMPNINGLTLIRQIRENDHKTPIIVSSSFFEQELFLAATNLSIDAYLLKPVGLEKLTSALYTAIKRNNKESIG